LHTVDWDRLSRQRIEDDVQASAPVDLTARSVVRFAPMIRRRFSLPLDIAGRYVDRVRVFVASTFLLGIGRFSPGRLAGARSAPAPTLASFVTADRARQEARSAEADIMASEPRSKLHGIPYCLKHIHDTAGIRTAAQSRLLADNVPATDNLCQMKLAYAGAVLLGKNATWEFAHGGSSWDGLLGRLVHAGCRRGALPARRAGPCGPAERLRFRALLHHPHRTLRRNTTPARAVLTHGRLRAIIPPGKLRRLDGRGLPVRPRWAFFLIVTNSAQCQIRHFDHRFIGRNVASAANGGASAAVELDFGCKGAKWEWGDPYSKGFSGLFFACPRMRYAEDIRYDLRAHLN
jgi:hypothetical protein